MMGRWTRLISAELLIAAASSYGQGEAEPNNTRALIEQGNQALAQMRLQDAAMAFQRAIDLNPSSAKAHEQLGVTLMREIANGNVRPSADSDVSQRAEDNLKRAVELAPSATRPLSELSELEALLAERSSDPVERSDRYRDAQNLLKQVLAVDPGKADAYLRLANLERDEFSPAIQQAKARGGGKASPLSDFGLRHSLQRQYGDLINDAITNTQRASEMNANSPKPLLMMWRLLQERALIRDTLDEYTSDMHEAEDWQRQFLSTGSHTAAPE